MFLTLEQHSRTQYQHWVGSASADNVMPQHQLAHALGIDLDVVQIVAIGFDVDGTERTFTAYTVPADIILHELNPDEPLIVDEAITITHPDYDYEGGAEIDTVPPPVIPVSDPFEVLAKGFKRFSVSLRDANLPKGIEIRVRPKELA